MPKESLPVMLLHTFNSAGCPLSVNLIWCCNPHIREMPSSARALHEAGIRDWLNTRPFQKKRCNQVSCNYKCNWLLSHQDCCFLESQLCWVVVYNVIRLTMTCNTYESREVAGLFIVRFPVSASTENTWSTSPKENGKTIQSSDTFIKWPGAHWLIFSHLSDNTPRA